MARFSGMAAWCAMCHAAWVPGADECAACGSDFPTAVRYSYLPAVGTPPPSRPAPRKARRVRAGGRS